jgi:GT2 family glycosyltransferase
VEKNMKVEQPLVSIISVNFNQIQVTLELLESLRNISFHDLEIILVDNGSTEDSTKLLSENYPEVHYIFSDKNLGFSGGNNLGIQASKGEYLFFVNNDAVITAGCIETLLRLFNSIPRLGIVSPLICYDPKLTNNQQIIQYAGATHVHPMTGRNEILGEKQLDKGQFKDAKETAYVHGAAMMIKREVINHVGVMPEEFFLYYEELDWSEQIRNAGYKVFVEPNALVFHKESLAVGKNSTLKIYYHTRNRIFFVRRNRSGSQLAIFYLFLFSFTIPKNTFLFLKNREWDHIIAFYRGVWWNLAGNK